MKTKKLRTNAIDKSTFEGAAHTMVPARQLALMMPSMTCQKMNRKQESNKRPPKLC